MKYVLLIPISIVIFSLFAVYFWYALIGLAIVLILGALVGKLIFTASDDVEPFDKDAAASKYLWDLKSDEFKTTELNRLKKMQEKI